MDIFKKTSSLIEKVKNRVFIQHKFNLVNKLKSNMKKSFIMTLMFIVPIFLAENFLPINDMSLIMMLFRTIMTILTIGFLLINIRNIYLIYQYIRAKMLKNYAHIKKSNKNIDENLNKEEIEEIFSMNLSEEKLIIIKECIMNYGALNLNTVTNLTEEGLAKYHQKKLETISEKEIKEKNISNFFNNFESEYINMNTLFENDIKEIKNNKEIEINKINLKTMI